MLPTPKCTPNTSPRNPDPIKNRGERKSSSTRYLPATGFAPEDDSDPTHFDGDKRRGSLRPPPLHRTHTLQTQYVNGPTMRFSLELTDHEKSSGTSIPILQQPSVPTHTHQSVVAEYRIRQQPMPLNLAHTGTHDGYHNVVPDHNVNYSYESVQRASLSSIYSPRSVATDTRDWAILASAETAKCRSQVLHPYDDRPIEEIRDEGKSLPIDISNGTAPGHLEGSGPPRLKTHQSGMNADTNGCSRGRSPTSETPSASPSSHSARSENCSPAATDGSERSPLPYTASSSRMLALEILDIFQELDDAEDVECNVQSSPSVKTSTIPDSISPSNANDGSGTHRPFQKTSASQNSSQPVSSKHPNRFYRTRQDGDEDEREDEEERPEKRRNRGQGHQESGLPPNLVNVVQIPCPYYESRGCHGTNPSISELLRSLQNKHRVVFCSSCCMLLDVPVGQRKPENILKDHELSNCERRCINPACAGDALGGRGAYHIRTAKCPSWKALTKELRWSFIHSLLHDGREAPELQFVPGIAFEHNTEKRPSAQRTRARGVEVCRDLLRSLEVKEERLSTLENDLRAARDQSDRLQRRHDDKINELENIIEDLLERLTEKSIGIPPSLQKRLQTSCPKVAIAVMSTPYLPHANLPPTPDSILKSGGDLLRQTPQNRVLQESGMPWDQSTLGQVNPMLMMQASGNTAYASGNYYNAASHPQNLGSQAFQYDCLSTTTDMMTQQYIVPELMYNTTAGDNWSKPPFSHGTSGSNTTAM
jgi:hypothetical protein